MPFSFLLRCISVSWCCYIYQYTRFIFFALNYYSCPICFSLCICLQPLIPKQFYIFMSTLWLWWICVSVCERLSCRFMSSVLDLLLLLLSSSSSSIHGSYLLLKEYSSLAKHFTFFFHKISEYTALVKYRCFLH